MDSSSLKNADASFSLFRGHCYKWQCPGRVAGSNEGSCESWDMTTLVGPAPGLAKAQASDKSRCIYPWVLEAP